MGRRSSPVGHSSSSSSQLFTPNPAVILIGVRSLEKIVKSMAHIHEDQRRLVRRSVERPEVEQLRRQFEEEFADNPDAYHSIDIERVRTDDWQCVRFLERASSVALAFQQLSATLRWKRNIGLHEKLDEHFAREFYDINGVEILGRNAEGALVVWNTSKYNKHFSDLKVHIREFVLHEIETLDRMAGAAGMILISDSKHAGLFSVDLDITRYSNDMVMQHYPGVIRQSLILNLSSVLNPLFQLVLKFMNAEMRATTRIVTRANLAAHLESHFIPVEYGGTRHGRKVRMPPNAPSYTELAHIVLTEAQKTRYNKLIRGLPA